MESGKKGIAAFLLSAVAALIVTSILLLGSPLLTQVQRSFEREKPDDPVLLALYQIPKPQNPVRYDSMKRPELRKVKQRKDRKKAPKKPKLNVPLFDFSLNRNPVKGLKITALPHEKFADGIYQAAFAIDEVDRDPKIIRKVYAAFPHSAKRKNINGMVTLRFIVSKEGRVLHPTVVASQPPGVFDANALAAVLEWRFEPATRNGKPVDVVLVYNIAFMGEKYYRENLRLP